MLPLSYNPLRKTRVVRCTNTVLNDVLRTNVVHGYGFRAADRQGWTGPVRDTFREARADARAHDWNG